MRRQSKTNIKVTMANDNTSTVEKKVETLEVDLSAGKTTFGRLLLPIEDWDVISGRPWLQSVNPSVN